MKTIVLSPAQRAAIDAAANSLLPSQRENFLDNVGRRLGQAPTDFAVQHAIDVELGLNRFPQFLDSGA
jgi:hypothetical protein